MPQYSAHCIMFYRWQNWLFIENLALRNGIAVINPTHGTPHWASFVPPAYCGCLCSDFVPAPSRGRSSSGRRGLQPCSNRKFSAIFTHFSKDASLKFHWLQMRGHLRPNPYLLKNYVVLQCSECPLLLQKLTEVETVQEHQPLQCTSPTSPDHLRGKSTGEVFLNVLCNFERHFCLILLEL